MIAPTPPISRAELRRAAAAREPLTVVVEVRLAGLAYVDRNLTVDEAVEDAVLGRPHDDLGLLVLSKRIVGHVAGEPCEACGGSMLIEVVAAVIDYSDVEVADPDED